MLENSGLNDLGPSRQLSSSLAIRRDPVNTEPSRIKSIPPAARTIQDS